MKYRSYNHMKSSDSFDGERTKRVMLMTHSQLGKKHRDEMALRLLEERAWLQHVKDCAEIGKAPARFVDWCGR